MSNSRNEALAAFRERVLSDAPEFFCANLIMFEGACDRRFTTLADVVQTHVAFGGLGLTYADFESRVRRDKTVSLNTRLSILEKAQEKREVHRGKD